MIVATLTTLPSRIAYLEPVITSILNQTTPPDQIHLQLPKYSLKEDEAYVLPEFLNRNNKVKIHWLDKDYGPATKWLPALKQLQDDDVTLVIMDDDCFYTREMLQHLIAAYQEDPSRVYCSTGGVFQGRKINQFQVAEKPRKNALTILTNNEQEQAVQTVQGFSLIVFNPRLILGDLVDQLDGLNLSYLADDILLSALFERSKIARIQIAPYQVPKPLEQAEINPIHGNGNLSKMSLKTLNWVQSELKVWEEYTFSTTPKVTRKKKVKNWLKSLLASR